MLRSGSICVNILYRYLMSESETSDNGGEVLVEKGHKLKCLSDTFASYGGVLAKLSQLVSVENDKSSVFSDCTPFCQQETIEFFKEEYHTKKNMFFKDITDIDFNVFKAGSIGQVHKCKYKNTNNEEKDIIIKVQYLGLLEQFKSDIYLLDKVCSYLFYFSDLSEAITDIKTKLYEELNYTIEFSNQKTLYELWEKNKNITIAKLIPELSTDKLIAMDYIDAENLSLFIDNSTQYERNKIGKHLVEFIFTNLYKYGILYSDIHYGNFLVQDKNILCVTDFGCLHDMEDDILNNLLKLHKNMYTDNKEEFFNIVTDMGIIKEEVPITEESKDYMYIYFKLQYTPWITDDFEFTEQWLEESVFKNTNLMKDWVLPPNCVYLNKIPYGMYHILTKLNLNVNFKYLFNDLLKL